MSKQYYRELVPGSTLERVLLIQPHGKGPVTLFCPATEGEQPWSEVYEDFDEAVAVGADLAQQRGQPLLLETRDPIDWWMVNLAKDDR